MTYDEFEWHILRLVYEDGLDCLQPSYLAYALGQPHEIITTYIEHAVKIGFLEMDVSGDATIEYKIPGIDRNNPPPKPLWQQDEHRQEQPQDECTALFSDTTTQAEQEPGHAMTVLAASEHAQQVVKDARVDYEYSVHHQDEAQADGSIFGHHVNSPILEYNAFAEVPASHALTRWNEDAFRIETSRDSFCDPSQTVFMRQIRVYGVESEQMLRDHVKGLFESFGYRMTHSDHGHLRLERGSVAFILALVPLFVLVLPLFVYLFLYCMGRSTIHQEPVELDVRIRPRDGGGEPCYEIDLTFIGLHGVVLGAADQRVLNQEIDTLRDELRWALTSA